MSSWKRKRTSHINDLGETENNSVLSTAITKINNSFPDYRKFRSKKREDTSVKKFPIAKSHPLMAQCKKKMNLIQKNRVAKPRAHVTETFSSEPAIKNNLQNYKIPKKSTSGLKHTDNFNKECSLDQAMTHYADSRLQFGSSNENNCNQKTTKNMYSSSESNFEEFIKNQKYVDVESSHSEDSDSEIYEARKLSAKKNIHQNLKPSDTLKKLSKFREIDSDVTSKKLRRRKKINYFDEKIDQDSSASNSVPEKISRFSNVKESCNSKTGFENLMENQISDDSSTEMIDNAHYDDKKCIPDQIPYLYFSLGVKSISNTDSLIENTEHFNDDIKRLDTERSLENDIAKITKGKKCSRSKVSSKLKGIASRSPRPRKCKVSNEQDIFPRLNTNDTQLEERDSDATIIDPFFSSLSNYDSEEVYNPSYLINTAIQTPSMENIVTITHESKSSNDEKNIDSKKETNRFVDSATQTIETKKTNRLVDAEVQTDYIQNVTVFAEKTANRFVNAKMQTEPETHLLLESMPSIQIKSVGSQIEHAATLSGFVGFALLPSGVHKSKSFH